MPRLPRLAALALGTAALGVLAAGPAPAAPATTGDPTVSDPRILAHFDFTQGQTPENIALEPDGSADVTFAFAGQVARVDLSGHTEIIAQLPPVANPQTPNIGAAIVTGIARTHDGVLYVAYATGTAETGIWRVAPDGSAPEQIAQLPANSLPNGIAVDEECGTLYAADSVLGRVWSISLDDPKPRVWASGTELLPSAPNGFGANGLKLHNGAVWVSNSDRGTLLRIPFEPDRTAGPVQTRATGLDGVDDFAFTGYGDTLLAARVLLNEVDFVRADGTHKAVLTAAAGLKNPTSVAVRGKTVYVNSASYFEQQKDPNLLLARISKDK
ncbi:SMP-30/gluconolactonase/LRE family protein [Streptomyces sp. NPDC101160]|uniref:SMP-30/gluconolactonase/LRE family protein n=1 Tax=Streptomyces sp. NPDC101160 TaxID=3366118 RepID=UPI003803D94D